MKLLLINQTSTRVQKKWMIGWLSRLTFELKKRRVARLAGKELVVVLVERPEIRRLNRLYRGKDKATDILSFQGSDEDSVGELVICPAVLREQAKRTGLTPRAEMGYMIIHGVLHLLGYDHERPTQERRMFALQDAIFAKVNH
ncbi:MAG: rRNA maturation RNase YbeY [Bdellovibrionales bacterium]